MKEKFKNFLLTDT
jgi:hypothetical protein